jgi:hypothetical protein
MRYVAILMLLLSGGAQLADAAPPSPTSTTTGIVPTKDGAKVEEPTLEPDKRGTKEPAVVELSPSSVVKVEAVDKTARRRDYSASDWWLAYCTGALASITAVLALYTFRLYRATVGLGRDAKRSGVEQSERTERSITQATRAAAAMEDVATATKNNALLMQTMLQKQMRAYVSVDIGSAAYQDANLRFEALPLLTNTGLTPARNVSFKVMGDIVDGRDQKSVEFPDVGEIYTNDASIAPRQSFTIHGLVKERVPDTEVETIMAGTSKRLFAWGKVTYDDVYGGSWETNFCLNYIFVKPTDGGVRVYGFYYPVHNSAT